MFTLMLLIFAVIYVVSAIDLEKLKNFLDNED